MAKIRKQKPDLSPDLKKLITKIEDLEKSLAQCQDRELRALADYQNLLRQSQKQRINLIKLANADLILAILEPLEHLVTVSHQLTDDGLKITVNQMWKALANLGLEEIEVMGKEFDVETMEVIEKINKGRKVVEVLRKAYRLNGEVIQHARVILN